jgi:hypothetical protein
MCTNWTIEHLGLHNEIRPNGHTTATAVPFNGNLLSFDGDGNQRYVPGRTNVLNGDSFRGWDQVIAF